MPVRSASAVWKGSLKDGQGTFGYGAGEHAYEGVYSFPSRFEEGEGTNPEELIGAALASCFSMALSGALGRAGFEPRSVETRADVHLEQVDDAFTITRIELETQAEAPGIDEAAFQEQAEGAKNGCPVSRSLGGVEITLSAKLLS